MLHVDKSWYADPALHGPDYFRLFYGGRPEVEGTAQEVDFLVEKLELRPGAAVLDLCCGWGRHSLELARRGFRVVGVDMSEHFLAMARARAAAEGLGVDLLRGDMRHIPFQPAFDAVVMMGSPFGVLESDEEDERVFHAVARALKPHGSFFLATVNREGVIRNYRERDWRENADGTIVVFERRLDLPSSRNLDRMLVMAPGREWREHRVRFRFFTLTEFSQMLTRAGLVLEGHWSDFLGGEFTIDGMRLLLLARPVAQPVGQGPSPDHTDAGSSPHKEDER
ncbi:MAG: methyltransferase domain-containing protein [Chloroflexi bacterium]|nr:methyltransferase domain-containing protein [Chloroflexota bacterium]